MRLFLSAVCFVGSADFFDDYAKYESPKIVLQCYSKRMANILLIDNEQVLLSLISTTLRLEGHGVSAMCDPLVALASQCAGQAPR